MMDAVKRIDARTFFEIIGLGATSNHVPTLAKQLHTVWLHIEVVLLVFPIAVVGDVDDAVFLHRLNDGLEIFLTRRHVFQNDTVFDALAVCQGIAHTERVVEPGT